MTQDALDLLTTSPVARTGLRDRVLLLRSLDDFSVLDEEGLSLLVEQARDRTFAKGEVVTEEGSPPKSVYFIIDGQVSATRGKGVVVMKTGDRLGALSVFADAPNRRAVADVETRTFEVPAAVFKLAFEENFSLVRNGLRMMSLQLLRLRGKLPADANDPPPAPLGVPFDQPKTLAERLIELRGGVFASMNLDALVDLARSAVEVRVPAGHVFWRVGDPAGGSLQVAYGRIRCTAADGTHVDVGANFTLGVMDFLSRSPRSYEARAETDVIGYRMNGEDLLVILEMHVRVGLELLRTYALRLLERA